MSNLSIIFFITILAVGSQQFFKNERFRDTRVEADAVHATATQLAQAQHRRASDPINPDNYGVYATTPEQLVTEGYLPAWDSDSRYAFTFPASDGFAVEFVADTTGDAARASLRMGATAEILDDGVTVRFGFASGIALSLLDIYVKKEGDTMFGALEMLPGTGANIIMNDNILNSEGRIILRNSAGTANIEADTGNIDGFTARTMRIIN